ncbi:hypothetical protein M5D96_000461 [Drosophila gunungcola]|uniref:Uncharacterized protein n=1 Tax=Drosophila gunungcola TaxID=103775 RepID=A0A9P9YWR0_9MUSC|nr:hypothetical protein M5D96_000461 [Drosophila gunungcola]
MNLKCRPTDHQHPRQLHPNTHSARGLGHSSQQDTHSVMGPPNFGQANGRHTHSSLMIYALMWLSLAMTMEAIDGDAPVSLSLAEFPILPLEHGKPHYQQEETGLAGYTRNYYGPTDTATADDLAAYGNYAHKLLAATHSNAHHIPHPIAATSTSSLGSTANGFVPFHYSAKLHSQFTEDEEPRRDPSAHIDFVINAANYEPNSAGFEEVSRHREPFESHAYRVPRLPFPTSPPGHYHFEQISNYRENRQQEERQEQQDDSKSSKAIAGLPLAKHIEITKNVPVTHYQKQHVPYKQTIQVQVPRTVIAAIPKPLPIKIPVAQTVAVPQLQEVKIPIERVKPVPVEQPIPFVVERRVPYRVEKPVVSPVYYPYPVKVPVVRTVVHKQRPHPHYAISGAQNQAPDLFDRHRKFENSAKGNGKLRRISRKSTPEDGDNGRAHQQPSAAGRMLKILSYPAISLSGGLTWQ